MTAAIINFISCHSWEEYHTVYLRDSVSVIFPVRTHSGQFENVFCCDQQRFEDSCLYEGQKVLRQRVPNIASFSILQTNNLFIITSKS